MAKYFHGRRKVGQFEKIVEKVKGRLNCEIFEEWLDIGSSTTVYCGDSASCNVERDIGISEKALHTLKGMIEVSFGIGSILSLKSQVEESIGHEVNWIVTDKYSKAFSFDAPKCGRATRIIYQLTRFYEFTYYRKKFNLFDQDVWVQKWTSTLPEKTNNIDFFPDTEPYHESCNCPGKKESPAPDGYFAFDMGHISFRAPYSLTDSSFIVQVGEKKFEFNSDNLSAHDLDYGFSVTIPSSMVPEPLLFLGEITAQKIPGHCQKYVDQGARVIELAIKERGESVPLPQAQELKILE